MVLPLSHRIPRVLWYSGSFCASVSFVYRSVTFFGSAFQPLQLPTSSRYECPNPVGVSLHPGLGSYPFARHYLGNRCFTFFSSRYLDGSVPWVPFSYTILFMYGYQRIITGEFPHSEIFGSRFICNSPKLIAAYHVFHRRLVPRHPPYALSSLIKLITSTFIRTCLLAY